MKWRSVGRPVLATGLVVCCFAVGLVARQSQGDPEAATITNPVASTPESIAAGRATYDRYCASCHAPEGKGDMLVSITEDRGLPPPPSLVDEKWDHGASDGEVFSVTKWGVPPDYIMGPWDGRISDTDIWNVITYLRSLAQRQ